MSKGKGRRPALNPQSSQFTAAAGQNNNRGKTHLAVGSAFKIHGASSSRPPPSSSSSSEEIDASSDSQEADEATVSTGRPIKKFKCDICGHCCSSKNGISLHMNKHTGAKPFECQYCAKTFSRPSSLYLHRKTHFPPTFRCDYCPKMFTLKSNRDWHMNTHTGAKPFYCEHCNKRFAHPGDLSKHRDTHFEPKFECPFCHKKFAELKYCKRHWNGGKNYNIVCKVRLQQLAKQ